MSESNANILFVYINNLGLAASLQQGVVDNQMSWSETVGDLFVPAWRSQKSFLNPEPVVARYGLFDCGS
jgi:hypothetical protein